MKYLEFYNKYAESRRLPSPGLCHCFPYDSVLKMFEPYHFAMGYWLNAYDEGSLGVFQYEFNTLRQNVVLFMAAINGEL